MDKVSRIIDQAQIELFEEQFREAVEIEKEKLRRHRPWWHKVFPYKIKFERRK